MVAVTRKIDPCDMNRLGRPPDWIQEAVASADASSSQLTLVPAVSGRRAVLRDLTISVGAALTVTINDSVNTVFGPLYMAANTSLTLVGRSIAGGATGRIIRLQTSGAGNVSCSHDYTYEDS